MSDIKHTPKHELGNIPADPDTADRIRSRVLTQVESRRYQKSTGELSVFDVRYVPPLIVAATEIFYAAQSQE